LGRIAPARNGRDLAAVDLSKLQSGLESVFAKDVGDQCGAAALSFAPGGIDAKVASRDLGIQDLLHANDNIHERSFLSLQFAANGTPRDWRTPRRRGSPCRVVFPNLIVLSALSVTIRLPTDVNGACRIARRVHGSGIVVPRWTTARGSDQFRQWGCISLRQ